ncbi:MAG: acyl-CoA/acyl-ACP dehydrogenase [Proteobacteria bacterium]|nr:acyl-CoA/acyl-ACP dehydrogenase [Pseudomonadota bacterium]
MIANTNKELKLIEKAAYDFSRKELWPEREENDKFPFGPFFDASLKKAYDLDFFHSILPETYGGIGQGISTLCVILENICREDSSLGGIIFTNSAAYEILIESGSEEILKKLTESADQVNKFLIAFPVFSDPSQVRHMLKATKGNDGYELSGSMEYLVLGSIANQAIVPARIQGTDSYSFFLVDLKGKGVKVSSPIHSLGLHSCPAVDLTLSNTPGKLLGQEGQGQTYFKKMVDRLSVAAASMATGIMKGSFKEAMDYTKERSQGGRKIINWSEVKLMLANMSIKIKNAEMSVAKACQALDTKESGWKECSRAAALLTQETACDITTDGIQVMGGVGFMKDFGQEKRFRDAKHIQAVFGITPVKKIKHFEELL